MSTAPAAASELLRPLLARPAVSCVVVAASRTAVHLATGDDDIPVLSIVAPGGARLPGAFLLADPVGPPHVVDHGDLATYLLERFGSAGHLLVGDGAVALDGITVVVRRWWAQPSVRMPSQPAAIRAGAEALASALGGADRALPASIGSAAQRLYVALRGAEPVAITRAVHAMVGLGPGLTPAADDVLVGALLAWHYLGQAGWVGATSVASTVSTAVRERLHRTGAVSAALLHHAVRGATVPEGLLLLDALRAPAAVAAAVQALQRVGQDTGRSIAYGIQLAVQTMLGALDAERVAL